MWYIHNNVYNLYLTCLSPTNIKGIALSVISNFKNSENGFNCSKRFINAIIQ